MKRDILNSLIDLKQSIKPLTDEQEKLIELISHIIALADEDDIISSKEFISKLQS